MPWLGLALNKHSPSFMPFGCLWAWAGFARLRICCHLVPAGTRAPWHGSEEEDVEEDPDLVRAGWLRAVSKVLRPIQHHHVFPPGKRRGAR
eukprot:1614623-Pyramimonas_sp.AAC.1